MPLLSAALAIAALAAIESLLSARVAATMAPTGPYDPDRELVGQGLASIAYGMFGGMTVDGCDRPDGRSTSVGARHAGWPRLTHSLAAARCGLPGYGHRFARSRWRRWTAVLMVTSTRMISATHGSAGSSARRAPMLSTFVLTAVVTVCST